MATTDRLLYISSDGLVRQLGFDPTAADLGGAAGVASSTHSATSKTTPVDADELPMVDSADSWSLKKLTWANLKATLKTYFDTLYLGISATAANASQLLGFTWASPGTIGSTTPNSGAFTTLTSTGVTSHTVNSASAALTVTQTGSGNAFVVEDAASDATPFVIDAGGKVIVGHTAAIAGCYGDGASLYELGTLPRHFLQAYSADSYAPVVELAKSRGAAIGSHTVVQAMDELGTIRFSGSDGTAYKDAASIRAFVDGTPGTNDMPGRLIFTTTADGASSPTERMRIDSSGNVLVTNSGGGLGYGTGAGGTVTQATSKGTAVTLNKPCGQITMHNAALAAGASVYFSLVNSIIGSADTLAVHPVFFTGTAGSEYEAWVSYLVVGQAVIGVRNNTAGSRSDPLILNFAVIKGATA